MRARPTLFVCLIVALLCGCGSKISEANYYRVHYGMSEKDVEEELGPAHEESIVTTTAPARKLKTWTRGDLVIRVVFEDDKVVGRSREGAFKG